jgi:hypothetical protein
MTALTFLRVRDRLDRYGLKLELYAETNGFRWDIDNRPLQTQRVFPTVEAALEHADMYTRLWYEERFEASQASSPRSQPGDPARRDAVRQA